MTLLLEGNWFMTTYQFGIHSRTKVIILFHGLLQHVSYQYWHHMKCLHWLIIAVWWSRYCHYKRLFLGCPLYLYIKLEIALIQRNVKFYPNWPSTIANLNHYTSIYELKSTINSFFNRPTYLYIKLHRTTSFTRMMRKLPIYIHKTHKISGHSEVKTIKIVLVIPL